MCIYNCALSKKTLRLLSRFCHALKCGTYISQNCRPPKMQINLLFTAIAIVLLVLTSITSYRHAVYMKTRYVSTVFTHIQVERTTKSECISLTSVSFGTPLSTERGNWIRWCFIQKLFGHSNLWLCDFPPFRRFDPCWVQKGCSLMLDGGKWWNAIWNHVIEWKF